tara:strand:- start:14239 stop:14817 length:579 start_codon:yes stop_codon:yes gene_type:complete
MMKRIIQLTTIICFTLVTAVTVHAQDGFFSNAKTLAKGTGAIGLQPVFLTNQNDMMFIVRGAYGIQNGLTGHLKLGVFDNETYFGGHLETDINRNSDSDVDVAVLAGVYSYGDLGLKLGLNLSTDFEPVSIYSGVNYQPLFANETIHSVLIPIGFDIHLENGIDLMLEGNIPVNDDASYLESITFGTRIYLN